MLPALPPSFVPPPILMYHRVDVDRPRDAVGRQLTVRPAQFRAQLAYLKKQGFTGISMAQFLQRLERHQPLGKVAVLTFDDGYEDQVRYAVPLLRHYGDSATFYIVTGQLGRARHLTWAQVRSMAADGMDIAAHGVQHDDLSRLSAAQQAYEIDDSVAALERGLHRPVESYAYPSGRFNRETLLLVRRANVPLAVTTDPVYVLPPENRFEMTRVRVRANWTLEAFARALRAAVQSGQPVIR